MSSEGSLYAEGWEKAEKRLFFTLALDICLVLPSLHLLVLTYKINDLTAGRLAQKQWVGCKNSNFLRHFLVLSGKRFDEQFADEMLSRFLLQTAGKNQWTKGMRSWNAVLLLTLMLFRPNRSTKATCFWLCYCQPSLELSRFVSPFQEHGRTRRVCI